MHAKEININLCEYEEDWGWGVESKCKAKMFKKCARRGMIVGHVHRGGYLRRGIFDPASSSVDRLDEMTLTLIETPRMLRFFKD
jgi:hypothetical protein